MPPPAASPDSPTTDAASLHIHGIGARVEVALAGPRLTELSATMKRLWARCLAPHPLPGGVPVRDGGSFMAELRRTDEVAWLPTEPDAPPPPVLLTNDADTLMVRVTQRITTALIRAQVGQLFMFHAGAVAHPDTGRSLVFIAEGGTGKTTLTRLLGTRYGYLTDETVAVDQGGRIRPYPKPLSVRTSSGHPRKRELAPDELGLLPAPAAPTVGRLILLHRDDAHRGNARVTEVGRADAILAIAAQTSSLAVLDQGLHGLSDLIESTGPVLAVEYAEADALAGLADELLGAP